MRRALSGFAQSAEDVRDAIEYTLRTTEKAEGSVFVASKESITAKSAKCTFSAP